MSSLRARVVRGMGWRAFVGGSQILLQIVFTAILARLLDLADFGLAAMCLVFLRFVRALTDVGFNGAVIQSQTITPGQVSAVFTIQLLIKAGVCALCIVTAPLAAAFFVEPRLTLLVRVLALVILFDSLAFPHVLARKQLRFRGYSLLELAAMIAGNGIGIAMAFAGFGVWSLIARLMVQRGCFAAGVWPIVGWRPARPEFQGIRRYLTFGFTIFGSNAINFISQNLAAIIIGKFIGVETLGLYNVAHNLAIVPAEKARAVLATVLMPAYATLQDRLDALRRAVHKTLFSASFVFVPAMLGLAAVGPVFVPLAYGDKWAPAGEMVAILAIIGLLKGLEHLMRSVAVALGRPRQIVLVSLAEAIVSIPALWIASRYHGVWGVVIAYLGVSMLAFLMTAGFLQRNLHDRMILVSSTWRSALAGATMAIAVAAIPYLLEAPRLPTLVIQLCAGIAIYTVLRWMLMSSPERQSALRPLSTRRALR